MDDSTLIHPKNVCDNNCEQIKSLLDTPPIDGSNFFKYVNIFDDMECITTDSLYKYQNYNSAPFKNRNELFEILDGLREKILKVKNLIIMRWKKFFTVCFLLIIH